VLTDAGDYPGLNNTASNPNVVRQYCNGSRTIPELKSAGWQVPPGISDATVPNPIFNLTPTATVDEGNNWINIQWGPLTMSNPTTAGPRVDSLPLGNYGLATGSGAIGYIPTTSSTFNVTPRTDFFGNPRPDPADTSHFDIGAVEVPGAAAPVVAPAPAATLALAAFSFGNVTRGTTPANAFHIFILTNTGTVPLTGITSPTISLNPTDFGVPGGFAGLLTTCGTGNPFVFLRVTTLAPGASCTIFAQFHPTTIGPKSGTLQITDLAGTQTSALTGTAQ